MNQVGGFRNQVGGIKMDTIAKSRFLSHYSMTQTDRLQTEEML